MTLLIPFLGFSNGVIVGSGIVALITLLDIVPRLAQLTRTYQYIHWYETVIVVGATLAAYTSLTGVSFPLGGAVVAAVGFFMGVFVGMLASALAEIMNVMPIIVRRFRLDGFVIYILYALIFGKVAGSLIQWIVINKGVD
jgi:stage V sporulation protein AB